VGFFVVALCGFLASVYLIGEADNDEDKQRFINKAKHWNIIAVLCGILVFMASVADHIPLLFWIFGNAVGLIAVIMASLSLIVLWYLVYKGKAFILRPF